MENKLSLVLASNSLVRQNIFNSLGLKYSVITSTVEEKSLKTEPHEYVEELSKNKAHSVSSQLSKQAIIIAADTIIYMNGKKYEKPKSKKEAYNNIKEMSGNLTYAVTGVTILDLYKNKEICFSDTAKVYINKIADEDIRWYVENEKNVLNYAGYAMLGKMAVFLNKIEGDFNTLFGISPSKIYDKLKELGYKISDFKFE